jgi:hypothetical protein
MKYTTHNDEFPAINIDGTSLQGHIEANYLELVGLFGQPMPGDKHKVDAEWHIMFDNGQVASIYNWKNGFAFMGMDGTPVSRITTWNVGGRRPSIVDEVSRVLLEGRGALA